MAIIDMKTLKFANDENTYKVVDGEAVKKKVNLGNGIDLDSINESGFYRIGNTLTNAPTGVDYGELIVCQGGDTIAQIAIDYKTGDMFVRAGNPYKSDGTGVWTQWKNIYNTNDIIYQSSQPTGKKVGQLWLCPVT